MNAVKTPPIRSLIFSSTLFIFCLCALALIYNFRFDHISSRLGQFSLQNDNIFYASPPSPSPSSPPNDTITLNKNDEGDIRILIGILTLPDHYDRRHLLRMIYGTQSSPGTKIDIKFVFCNLTKDDQRVLVALEIMRYDDIVILNCEENMNKGKTYTYFSSLPEMLNDTSQPYPPYHYVMKADDDIYFRLEKLVESIKPLPREDLYYGFVIPCSSMNPFVRYMAGMGYLVSWDLVEWIKESEIPPKNLVGPEDRVLGEWLRYGHKGNNRFNAKWSMYDIPDPPGACTHEFYPDTIAVHKLKNNAKWIRTLSYFNVTHNLKPSKMYHIS